MCFCKGFFEGRGKNKRTCYIIKASGFKGCTTVKAADLGADELKELISKIIEEKFRDIIDPDCGLELREDFVQVLETSIASKERIPFDDVKKKPGLNCGSI